MKDPFLPFTGFLSLLWFPRRVKQATKLMVIILPNGFHWERFWKPESISSHGHCFFLVCVCPLQEGTQARWAGLPLQGAVIPVPPLVWCSNVQRICFPFLFQLVTCEVPQGTASLLWTVWTGAVSPLGRGGWRVAPGKWAFVRIPTKLTWCPKVHILPWPQGLCY